MRWTALIVLLASCSGTEPGEAAAPLRLGTHFGVAVMDPRVSGTFTRNIIELVYQHPLSTYFSSATADSTRVRLAARPDVPVPLGQLVTALTYPDLTGATVEGQDVILEFSSAETARAIDLDSYLVPDGPYRIQESVDGHLVLSRRIPGDGPVRIEVTAVPSAEEEWRRLVSGEFDVMPYVLSGAVSYLSQIPTLRIVRLSEPGTAALWFRMDDGPTRDPALRRAIAGLVHRKALALSVTGQASDARLDEPEDDGGRLAILAAGFAPERPLVLHLLVHDAQTDLVRAAMVLQQQLDGAGIEIRIDAVPEEEVGRRLQIHDFDLLLFSGDRAPRYYSRLAGGAQSLNGYVSPEFEAAVQAGDDARAKAILDRDLPLTPLFNLGESVAVRREFCNVHPHVVSDLTWLADVHRCRPGENE